LKLTTSSSMTPPVIFKFPKLDIPIIAYINIINVKRAPMFIRAGREIIKANSNFFQRSF
jgi:hypothetical protein